ncbi:hypothetical protein SAMN05216226_11519 [Halovenus aranensis]|jgi:hypothetical protein|uniref:Uncharacterized protein n=1 Tax=Halovenus aranensis TaxID=890420 RepID=A0A1G8YKJ0_9EURY|nr:hypothetical protein [Halovenus aranensis]SDK03187.1 hypothetical protein SAMN05216226_11519 [Halovenus aranensis]
MVTFGSYPPAVEAGLLIGAVLVEALVLYVGYGALEGMVGQQLLDRIKRT